MGTLLDRVMEYINENPEFTAHELAEHIGTNPRNLARCLRSLRKYNIITAERVNCEGRGPYNIYRVVKDCQEEYLSV